MPESMTEFARYLAAKRSVDDRALNRLVWERLHAELSERSGPLLEIADIGAGIGADVVRFLEWGLFDSPERVRCTLVEPREELLDEARSRLQSLPFECRFIRGRLEELASRPESRSRFDLVVGQALLDILPLSSCLDALHALARPEGLLYLPITFDGETILEPAHEADGAVLSLYHATMERSGSARTGRRLFHALRLLEAEVLEMGSSDWLVRPVAGSYPGDERFFLEFLLRTIEGAVRDRIDPVVLAAWMDDRRGRLASAELLFGAHQWDVLARKSGGS